MKSLLKKSTAVFVLAMVTMGCASTHPGKVGASVEKKNLLPMVVSARSVGKIDGNPFELIELTLENTSDQWLRISHTDVIFGPDETELSVVVGQDLKSWAEAYTNQLKVNQHNQDMIHAGLFGVGIIGAIIDANNSSSGSNLGPLVAGSGLGIVGGIKRHRDNAERAELVPEGHIYQPFSVPGKMFLRRWLLLNKPSNIAVGKLVLAFETIEGTKDTYEIPLL